MREDCTSYAEKLTSLFSDIVVRTLGVQLLRELDELDLTLSQIHALTVIAERRRTTVGALAEALGVTHPAAVKVVEKLCRKELVHRNVGAADHRLSELTATAEGRRLANEVREARVARLQGVLDRMPAEDRQALVNGLQSFVTAALQNERALDALCLGCQALNPSECDEFQQILGRSAGEPLPMATR